MGSFKMVIASIFSLIVLFSIALMIVGNYTEEWTCRETSSDWVCIGGRQCVIEAGNRTVASKGTNGTATCARTDWPATTVAKIISFFVKAPHDE